MTSDERNFRSSYYEKVGCHSVDNKNLNKILQDKIRNHSKLKQFCLCYTVPTAQRAVLWQLILGIHPLHKENTDFVIEQRKAVFEDLARGVRCMQYEDNTTKKKNSMMYYYMWLLENNQLLHPGLNENNKFINIVGFISQIFDDEVECYWISKEFFECFVKSIQHEYPKLKELTQTLLKREDMTMSIHLEKLGVFENKDFLEKWYTTCFAGLIGPETDLVKVWDKICGGSTKIVIFVFLELVKTLWEKIMNCKNINDLKSKIEEIKMQDLGIVNKAIKAWQNNKNHNEITVH